MRLDTVVDLAELRQHPPQHIGEMPMFRRHGDNSRHGIFQPLRLAHVEPVRLAPATPHAEAPLTVTGESQEAVGQEVEVDDARGRADRRDAVDRTGLAAAL